jgi:hypothetical protein
VFLALGDALRDLASGGDQAAVGTVDQGGGVLLEGQGHRGQSGGDGRPVVLGGRRHEVEHVAAGLERGGDDVERHGVVAALVGLDDQPEALAHRPQGDAVDVIDGFDALEPGQGVAGEAGVVGEPVGRQVVELGVAPRDSQIGRLDRARVDHGVEVGIGHGVDGGGWTVRGRRLGHPPDATGGRAAVARVDCRRTLSACNPW